MVMIFEAPDNGLGSSIGRGIAIGLIILDIGIEDSVGIAAYLYKAEIGTVAFDTLLIHMAHDDIVSILSIAVEGMCATVVSLGMAAHRPMRRIAVQHDLCAHRLGGINIIVHVFFKGGIHAVGTIVAQDDHVAGIDVEQRSRKPSSQMVLPSLSVTTSVNLLGDGVSVVGPKVMTSPPSMLTVATSFAKDVALIDVMIANTIYNKVCFISY